jgi:hypothetical protein
MRCAPLYSHRRCRSREAAEAPVLDKGFEHARIVGNLYFGITSRLSVTSGWGLKVTDEVHRRYNRGQYGVVSKVAERKEARN